ELRNLLKNIRIEEVTRDKSVMINGNDGMELNSYEIIFFYLQTKLEYFTQLMGKYGNDRNGKA
ncbi:hypothetical protein LOAG_16280, partial [Loa loa]